MRFILALPFVFFPSIAFAECNATKEMSLPIVNQPSIELCRIAYETVYNPKTKTPFYSAEILLKVNMGGREPRIDAFKADPNLPEDVRAELSDYYRSGYARGHMAPAGDFMFDSAAMLESFYMSNMIPEIQKCNNSGVWAQIEKLTRSYAVNYGEAHVFTGPIYRDLNMKYIGIHVAVPDELFKVVYIPSENMTVTFIVPNVELCKSVPGQFTANLHDVELATGMKFNYPNAKEAK